MSTNAPTPRWIRWLVLLIAFNAAWVWAESLANPATGAQRAIAIGAFLVVLLPSLGILVSKSRRVADVLMALLCAGMITAIVFR